MSISKSLLLAFALTLPVLAPAAASAASKETAPAPAPAPRASTAVDAGKLRVEVGRAGLRPTGFVEILGEVWNDTDRPIEHVVVHLDLLDAQGQSLDITGFHRVVQEEVGGTPEERSLPAVAFVPPGGSTPFRYLRDVKKIKGTYASHKARATARFAGGAIPVAVVESPKATPAPNDQVVLEGTLRANGACRSPEVVFGSYDANGKLLDLVSPRHTPLDDWYKKDLPASQPLAFKGAGSPKNPWGAKVKTWGVCSAR